jgi:hypothetical protein
MPPAQQSGKGSTVPAAAPTVVGMPDKQDPLTGLELERVIDLNKPAARAEKALVGKKVTLNIYYLNKRDDLKTQYAFGNSTLANRDPTTYICSTWDKAFKKGGWLNATVAGVTSRKTGLLVENVVALNDCTAGTRPQTDANAAPMTAQEVEGLIKAAKSADKATRQVEDKYVQLKVMKQFKDSLPSRYAFQSLKQRGEFVVVYNCNSWDKSFKVGATVYATFKDVTYGMDDNDVSVGLTDCSTKR